MRECLVKTLDDALSLSGDTYIGTDSDDGASCLYVYGRGIVLGNDEEIEIARELVVALELLAGKINHGGVE